MDSPKDKRVLIVRGMFLTEMAKILGYCGGEDFKRHSIKWRHTASLTFILDQLTKDLLGVEIARKPIWENL
jgi:hypothetical protein